MLPHSPLALFEKRLSYHLNPEEENELFFAARYAAFSEGKRIRPRLCIETGLALGAPLSSLLDPACALELIHTSSLIHDDLPCMDDDDFRRGRPSLHKAFDEALALLTGDFLLVYPFEILANGDLPSKIACSLIALLSRKIGAHGMILGQHLDLSMTAEAEAIGIEIMYRHKTADLIEASLKAGALVAAANDEVLEEIGILAQRLGLAYQLHNDLIDHCELSGRMESSDEKNEKRTLCQLLGRERVEEKLEELIKEIFSHSKKANLELPVLYEICSLFSKTISGMRV